MLNLIEIAFEGGQLSRLFPPWLFVGEAQVFPPVLGISFEVCACLFNHLLTFDLIIIIKINFKVAIEL